MPLTDVLAMERFRDTVGKHGVAILGKKVNILMAYITRWVEELQASTEAELARKQFGWLPDDSGFIIGDKEITATEIKYSPPTATTIELVPMFGKTSSMLMLEKRWKLKLLLSLWVLATYY
jgi:hypothetical protein